MRKGLWLAIVLVIAVALVAAVGCTPTESVASQQSGSWTGLPSGVGSWQAVSNSQVTGIWVSGEGTVAVVPDLAVLRLGVSTLADTVEEALGEASEAMEGVMAALIANGVAENDIQTQYFSIYPEYSYGGAERALVGYRVTNTVTAKIRNVDEVGVVIDAVALAGGDLTQVQGVSFMVDNPSPFHAQARAAAVADAQGKAEQLASLLGVTLGSPIYVSESYIQAEYMRYGAEGAILSPSTPISPGELEIQLAVQIAYGIE